MMLCSDAFEISKLCFSLYKLRETSLLEMHKICLCSKYRRSTTAVVIHQLAK